MLRYSSTSPADQRAHMPVVRAEEYKQPLQAGEQLMNKDTVSDSPSNMQIATASPASERFRRDLSVLLSRIASLEMRYDAQSKELDSAENKFRASQSLVEEKDRTIATLTAQVDHEKCALATKTEQVAAERRDKEKLQRDFEALSSHVADLEQRYDALSKDIRNELRTKASLLKHPIAFLETAFMQAQSEDRARAEQFATALVHLWDELCPHTLSSQLEQRKVILGVAGSQLRDSHSFAYSGGTSMRTRCTRLSTTEYEQAFGICSEWLDSERKTFTDAVSQMAELQMRCRAQSKQIDSVLDKIEANESLVEQKDRTITILTREVNQWKRAVATMAEEFAAERRAKEQLLLDLAAFSPRIAHLQQYYDARSKAIRDGLQTKTSLLEHTITFLNTTFMQAQSEDRAKAEQFATALRDLEELRCTLSEQMTSLHERYVALPQELKSIHDELHSIEILYPNFRLPLPHQPT